MSITPGSGMFEVCESGTLVVSGRVFQPNEPIIDLPLCDPVEEPQDAHLIRLTSSDIYKQLRLRGYDYGPTFQGILSASNKGKAVVFREGGGRGYLKKIKIADFGDLLVENFCGMFYYQFNRSSSL